MKPFRNIVKSKVIQFYFIIIATESKKKKSTWRKFILSDSLVLVYLCFCTCQMFTLFVLYSLYHFFFFLNFYSPT